MSDIATDGTDTIAGRQRVIAHRRMLTRSGRRAAVGYLFIGPWLLGFLIFAVYPIVMSAYYSLTNYNILNPPTYVGLQNYRYMFRDPLFWKSLTVTGIYCGVAVPGSIVVGYTLALMLSQRVRWLPVWRSVYFLPSVVPAIAGAYLWQWMFNPIYGFVNSALHYVGISGPQWFASTTWVLPTFILLALWGSGSGLLLYLAALQQVPKSLYDACKVDGGNAFQRLIHVTLPMTSPVILFQFLTSLIASFQVFTAGYVITQGGPDNASLFYILNLYENGWQYFRMGYASALAWILLLLTLGITGVTLLIARRIVYYEYAGR
jgi:multiple sugar transport system permease protein